MESLFWIQAAARVLAVFVISYFASWRQMGTSTEMYSATYERAHRDLQQIEASLKTYAKMKGTLPESLDELGKWQNVPSDEWHAGQLLDPWRHAYHYDVDGDKYKLYSLGADGKLGGVGLDADIYEGDQRGASKFRLPLQHFLFDTPGSDGVFAAAILASLATAGICYQQPLGRKSPTKFSVAGIIGVTGAAIFVAIYLALLYIQASQSGH